MRIMTEMQAQVEMARARLDVEEQLRRTSEMLALRESAKRFEELAREVVAR